MPTIVAYSPDALSYDAGSNTWTLSSSYNVVDHRVEIEFSDDDNMLNGDTPGDEVGTDTNQTAIVNDMLGNPVSSGQVYNEEYYAISTPDGTEYIDVIEIGGTVVGYLSTAALTPGTSYNVQYSADVDLSSAYSYSSYYDVPCFGPRTLITTKDGPRRIDTLSPGDAVKTKDNGLQTLLWVGRFDIRPLQALTSPSLLPVWICPDGVLNPKFPLALSPQHRVLLSGNKLELLFGDAEVFAHAGHLLPPTEPVGIRAQTYYHLLFERHEVIRANGIWVESLFLPDEAARLYPQPLPAGISHSETARPCLSRWEAELWQQVAQKSNSARAQSRRKRVA